MIAIADYGAGNLRSVQLGFARIGAETIVTADPAQLTSADGIVLPGVGAFGDAMQALADSGLIPVLRQAAENGVPLLGICLGMQALFDSSEEAPGVKGLGLIKGTVRRFTMPDFKIPHMGWNTIRAEKACPLLDGTDDQAYVYFVHSYACVPADKADILTTTDYGGRFCSAVQHGNIIGVQFHPEKSGETGQQLLRRFVRLTKGVTAC